MTRTAGKASFLSTSLQDHIKIHSVSQEDKYGDRLEDK